MESSERSTETAGVSGVEAISEARGSVLREPSVILRRIKSENSTKYYCPNAPQ
jgi:hypothetical protein